MRHLILIVGFTLVSGAITSLGFLVDKSLYWDTSKLFTQFRDPLHSLNVFGEFAWWFPHVQHGLPGYYHALLGMPSCLDPAYFLLGLWVWLLGRLGWMVENYQALYVFYFGFWVPFIFLSGVYVVSRLWFRRGLTQFFLMSVASFSPGVIFGVSDVGYLESIAYGLFFIASVGYYLKNGGRRYFTLCLICVGILGINLHHAFLYWNLFAIPLTLGCCLLFGGKRFKVKLKIRYQEIGWPGWAALVGIYLLGVAPNILVYSQGKDLIRTSLGPSQSYPLRQMASGNPLESLSIGLPGVGFDWDEPRKHFGLMPFSSQYHTQYAYMGLLILPLWLLSLFWGRKFIRYSLFTFALVFFGILPLSAHSPWFASLLLWITPLKSANHFSDAGFQAGAFLILLFGAGEGFRLLERRRFRAKFARYFLLTSILSFGVSAWVLEEQVSYSNAFGFAVVSFVLFSALLGWSLRENFSYPMRLALIALVLLDVTTHTFLYIRNIWSSEKMLNTGWPAYSKIDESPATDQIGIKLGRSYHYYTNYLLMNKSYYHLLRQRVPLESIPKIHWLDQSPQSFPHFNELSSQDYLKRKNIGFNIKPLSQSYNEKEILIKADRKGYLFLRQGYSPFWKVWVNGVPTAVQKTLGHYLLVPLNRGISEIKLSYTPFGVFELILINYSILFCLIFYFMALPILYRISFFRFRYAGTLERA